MVKLRNLRGWVSAVLLLPFFMPVRAWAVPARDPHVYSGVLDKGAYGFALPEATCSGYGPDAFPYQFWFNNSPTIRDSFLLFDVHETNPDAGWFTGRWEETTALFEAQGRYLFGDALKRLSFDRYSVLPGDDVYVFYFLVEQDEAFYSVTACYRFCTKYMAEFIGIDIGDMPDMYAMTKRAAESFVDLGGERNEKFVPLPLLGRENWPLSLHNPFAVVENEMAHRKPPVASARRRRDDHEIVWKDPTMERILRTTSGRAEGTLSSSDFDNIEELCIIYYDNDALLERIEFMERAYATFEGLPHLAGNKEKDLSRLRELLGKGPHYYVYIPTVGTWYIPVENAPILDISDFIHLKNIKKLTFRVPTVTQIGPLSQLTGLTSLYLSVSPQLADLSPLGSLAKLKRLYLFEDGTLNWGVEYDQITDLSALAQLKNLEWLALRVPNAKEVSVLAQLPILFSLHLFCDETADTTVLLDSRIYDLVINGVQRYGY